MGSDCRGSSEPAFGGPCPKSALKMQMSFLYLTIGKGHRLLIMKEKTTNACLPWLLCPQMVTGVNVGDAGPADTLCVLSRCHSILTACFLQGEAKCCTNALFSHCCKRARGPRDLVSSFLRLNLSKDLVFSSLSQLSGFPQITPGHWDFSNQEGQFRALQFGSIRDPLSFWPSL